MLENLIIIFQKQIISAKVSNYLTNPKNCKLYCSYIHIIIIGDGEDYVIMQDGKLSDVRGFRRFPFICQFHYPPIANETLACPSCKEFINSLPKSSMKLTIFQKFHKICESQLITFFSSKGTNMCSMLSKVLKQAIAVFEEKFIDTNDICELSVFKHCNLTPIQAGNNNCVRCKLIAEKLKKLSFGVILNQYLGNYLPYISFIITKLCSKNAYCSSLDITKVIQRLILFETKEDDFPSVLCSLIGLCN